MEELSTGAGFGGSGEVGDTNLSPRNLGVLRDHGNCHIRCNKWRTPRSCYHILNLLVCIEEVEGRKQLEEVNLVVLKFREWCGILLWNRGKHT